MDTDTLLCEVQASTDGDTGEFAKQYHPCTFLWQEVAGLQDNEDTNVRNPLTNIFFKGGGYFTVRAEYNDLCEKWKEYLEATLNPSAD
jgi:hypothetical protein